MSIKKLRSLGWNEHDIANYDNVVMDLDGFKVKVLGVVLEVISHKYGVFQIKFNPNPMAKELYKKLWETKILTISFVGRDHYK